MDDKAFSCRLNNNERKYLEKSWNNKFSDFVHAAIKKDLILIKNNKKQNIFQKFTYHFLMLGIGSMFVLFSLSISTFAGFLILMALGSFFTVSGLAGMFFEIRNIKM